MEAADESVAVAGEGQLETQEQLEEEDEVRTNTKQFCITAITDHWTRFTLQGMTIDSMPLK